MLIAERYTLGPSLGRGGMGEVFQATDEQLGRPVAVKLLLPSDHDARAGERFQREARAAARLSDPHVVSVYDFGPHGDGFFLVMELVEGHTVAAEIARSGPLSKERAIDIVEQAAAGLAAAHREDIVHRDVKPANLLLTADGTVKVADFGIAHLPGDGATTLTATGQIVGSTHYLAPERARGAQAGREADVYALGCVLYQLVTGQPPFTGDHPAAILYQHVDAAPAPPSLIRPELSGPFEAVLLRMLAKDAADRPSAFEIATGALRVQPDLTPVIGLAAAAELPIAAQDAAPAVAAADAEPIAAAQPIASEPPARTPRKALLAGGIAVLAAGAAVVAGVVLNDHNQQLPPTTDVGPGPGSSATTPASRTTPTRTASAGGTRSDDANQVTSSTSTRPSQSASTPQTPSAPSTGTSSPATSSPRTSAPSRSSTTPSVSTPAPSTTANSPSTTPSSSSPAPSSTPSSSPQLTETPPAAD